MVVEIPENDLTDTELKIVRSWFNHAEAVRADPWLYIANGRHRLWSTMPFMSQPVPVAGCDLKGANPVDAEDIGPSWTKYFVEDLRALHRLTWFDVGDPVNARFCRALAQAADGAFPSPV
ncbi:hypothetical protein [Intrasporangium sp.]|uniref:hypothetical protein n=1 Tax=Intrasporangium sp. TaxID=1925024 RepID=UPI003365AF40